MNSLEYTNIQGFKLVMKALLGGTFLPVQRTCKKKAKFSYRLYDPGGTGPLRALVVFDIHIALLHQGSRLNLIKILLNMASAIYNN